MLQVTFTCLSNKKKTKKQLNTNTSMRKRIEFKIWFPIPQQQTRQVWSRWDEHFSRYVNNRQTKTPSFIVRHALRKEKKIHLWRRLLQLLIMGLKRNLSHL